MNNCSSISSAKRTLLISALALCTLATVAHGGLVAHYTFDDGGNLGVNAVSGGSAFDLQTTTGLAQDTVTTKFGSGAGTIGAGSDVGFSGASGFVDLDNFTVSLHFRASSIQAGGHLFNIQAGGSDGRHAISGDFSGNADLAYYAFGSASDDNLNIDPATGSDYTADWVHVAMTFGTEVTMYVNGVAYQSGTPTNNAGLAVGPPAGVAQSIELGGLLNSANQDMAGLWDDVAIYDEVLTAGQINWLKDNAAVDNPVPEPSTAFLGLAGLVTLAFSRKRQRK